MEELRTKHKSLQNAAHHIALECIHPQSSHGSPYHVHPYPSPVRLHHAFTHNSPTMFHPKGLKPHLEGRPSSVAGFDSPSHSPIVGRALCLTPRASPRGHLADTLANSLTLTADTDTLLAKISAMFPTVSETHIKILLKKYYNREAVVISALQVEKHPMTTPGPRSMSPAPCRLHRAALGVTSALHLARGLSDLHAGHYTPLSETPHGSPMLLRPTSGASSYYGTNKSSDGQPPRHHSPKMKLKYLKSLYPQAEETLILDVLANKDNNVQKAGEELARMGFTKKEPVKKREEPLPPPPLKEVHVVRTAEEKTLLKECLMKQYPNIPERVILLALESVDYHGPRAEQVLDAVTDPPCPSPRPRALEASKTGPLHAEHHTTDYLTSPPAAVPPGPPPPARRLKAFTDYLKPILKSSTSSEPKYRSVYSSPARGPDATIRCGPKDSLLLEDYMAWNGPNPEFRTGQSSQPQGPSLRALARGPQLARGPALRANGPAGLAKGSIYQKLNKKSAKIVA